MWAWQSGTSANFFAFGLIIDIVYGVLIAASILARRNIVGWAIAIGRGLGPNWRSEHRDFVRRSRWASIIWVGLFALRLAVQGPLYLANMGTALGAAKLAMGLPLFALAAYLTWALLAGHIPAAPASEPADPEAGNSRD
ncbi:DUF3159 domain-containing protein [Nanchangia anserum]|uniref:DUF3159 domain-containing protein n=1 Tax=Nanchangia anserum TaxID=2692125 RepID=UPI001883BB6A|nr:DUF3159 domain-containing protein [Nanchangia anserum]QOX81103.1 DUF3159 domain-containing protein [Nanchangia anserum]